MSFFEELKRRNVFKVGIAYLVGAWLIVQFSDILLDNMEAPAWVLQAIMLVLFIGFLIALFVAWAFELTPEGLKPEKEVDRSQSITSQTGKKLNSAILVMMALAIAYLLFDKFSAPEPASTPAVASAPGAVQQDAEPAADSSTGRDRLSIAVLPFDNRSNREEDQFFTDGIHDDLLTTIARIGSMKVISRTSVMEYKNTTKKIPEIAKELGVANILEGGIQRSGNQVRINVQLIDAQTDEHLWAEIFDRELTAENLFAIQSEISTKIADALKATLSPGEQKRINTVQTANLDAYDAYLRARQLMANRRVADLRRAASEYQKAVELDPQFALAWVGVADSHYLLANYTHAPTADTIAIREDAVQNALALNPDMGEAYVSLATIHEFYDRDDEMTAAFEKAIELSPNYATAYHWYSQSLTLDPLRGKERLGLIQKAIELDPRSMVIGSTLAKGYLDQGLFSQGERQALKVIELNPEFPNAYHALVDHYFWNTGELAKSLDNARTLEKLNPGSYDPLWHQVDIYMAIGDLDAASNIQEKITEINPEHWWAGYQDMLIAASSGNAASATESVNWLLPRASDSASEYKAMADTLLISGDVNRAREVYLRAHPELGKPEEWISAIHANPFTTCLFSWVLMQTGDAELGKALLEDTTNYLEQELPAAVEHADRYQPDACYLVAGETGKALATMEQQLAHGHFVTWIYDHKMPMYRQLQDEPRYHALIEERDRKIEYQRELIAHMAADPGS